MGLFPGTSEIVEAKDEPNSAMFLEGYKPSSSKSNIKDKAGKKLVSVPHHGHAVDNELSKLFETIDLRASLIGLGSSHQSGAGPSQKNTFKKPVKCVTPRSSGIGISENVSLKKALRGLCISQASEMAAMKRLSKPAGLSGISEAGTIKRLYSSVVVRASEPNIGRSEDEGNMVEILLVPEKNSPDFLKTTTESSHSAKVSAMRSSNQNLVSSHRFTAESTSEGMKTNALYEEGTTTVCSMDEIQCKGTQKDSMLKGKVRVESYKSIPRCGSEVAKARVNRRAIKPVLHSRNITKKKKGMENSSMSNNTNTNACDDVPSIGLVCNTHKVCPRSKRLTPKSGYKEEATFKKESASSTTNRVVNSEVYSKVDNKASKADGNADTTPTMRIHNISRTREKGEFSQSSKSSMGDYSSSTSISEESNLSGSSCNGNRPHMSKDSRWEAIRYVELHCGSIGLRNFQLLKKLGCGDIGTVYLAELIGTKCHFALKVMDNEFLASRKKIIRAQTEREILQMLDHPFLPTLYSHFTTDKFTCLVMEYCPGGDLHVLRQKQPGRCFPEPAARFYAAEVLLALEYLHMLGVVYRDLKPENILVREDGHIMLSDFDLSLRSEVSPMLLRPISSKLETSRKCSGPCPESSCMEPLCLQPSWVPISCFTPRLTASSGMKSHKSDPIQPRSLPQLVAEPTDARSNSFVGTHEYLAPEIIKGDGHGSAVDWWTFGIFLYELLFSKTPFKGYGNDETLANVVTEPLRFPESRCASFSARDLIEGLLVKEPDHRLGSSHGAAEIKQHPFFSGLNWALIRCAIPPETPRMGETILGPVDTGTPTSQIRKKELKCLEFRSIGEREALEFELF